MIHNFKHYTPFIIIINIGHIPYAVQNIPVAYFVTDSLYLVGPFTYFVYPSTSVPFGN